MDSEAPRQALPARVRAAIDRYRMLDAGDTVLAAVSGGMDSMVMLHVLHGLGYRVTAAHFDHQTRDGASARDAAFVREACARLGVPLVTGQADVQAEARRRSRSFEHWARTRRYDFLMDAARRSHCAAVATAHHEQDQAETMLMGLLGLASDFGISGIAPVAIREKIRLIRPLIACPHDAIVSWAGDNGINWREDESNTAVCYTRNRIRHECLPVLEQYAPHVRRRLAHVADILRTDLDYLDMQATQYLKVCFAPLRPDLPVMVIDKCAFNHAPEAMRRHMLRRLAARMDIPIDYEGILRALAFVRHAASGKQVDLGGGAILYMGKTRVHVVPPAFQIQRLAWAETPMNIPGETRIPGFYFTARTVDNAPGVIHTLIARSANDCQYFDLSALNAPVMLRTRRSGERMRPFGMDGHKNILDVMADCGIPRYLRDATPLLVMNDEILWIAGCRRSAAAALSKNTEHILEIRITHENQ